MKKTMVERITWLLPRKVVYWAAIRLGSYGTAGKYSHQVVPELTFMDALSRWEEDDKR